MQKRGINGIKKRKTRGAKKDTVCKDSDVQTDYHCAGARASTMWHRVKNLDLQVLLRRLACGLEKKKCSFKVKFQCIELRLKKKMKKKKKKKE